MALARDRSSRGKVLAYVLAPHEDAASAPAQRIVSSVFSWPFLHGWLGGLLAVTRRAFVTL